MKLYQGVFTHPLATFQVLVKDYLKNATLLKQLHQYLLLISLKIMDYPNKLRDMSDLELSKWQSGWKERSHQDFLAKQEWRIRDKIEQLKLNKELIEIQNKTSKELLTKQHELNKELTKSQNRTIIIASLIASLVGIIGVVVGVILTNMTTKPQVPHTQQSTSLTPAKEYRLNTPNEKIENIDDVSSQTPNK